MTVRILTGALLGVLSDLIQTADRTPEGGIMGGVVLHTGRGYHGGEPGKVEILAGISSDRHVAGHTYAWCSGQLSAPTWWSVRDTRAVISVFKAARGKDKLGTHAVEIFRTGGEVLIREDPNLIDEGVSLSFGEGELSDYPAPTLYRLLDAPQPATVQRDGAFVDATPRTHLVPAVLDPFLKVARRRGDILALYRTHQEVRILVQIGESYRGLLMPYRVDAGAGDTEHPDADLHAPDVDHERWRPATPPAPDQDDPAIPQLDFDELDPEDAVQPPEEHATDDDGHHPGP